MRTRTTLATLALFAVTSVLAFSPSAHAEFLRAGVQVWTPTGSATIDQIDNEGTQTAENLSGDVDDSSGIGLTVYGLLGLFDDVDAGLAIHYLGTVEHVREDKTAFDLGSQTDLNLRLAYSLPIPAVLVSIHGEGGLTLFSPKDELPLLPIDSGTLTYNSKLDYPTNDTNSLGWNAGGGVQVGYSILPFFTLFVGADFQLYDVQLFKGSAMAPDNLTGSDTLTRESNLSGSRVRFSLGVEFNL